MSARDRDAVVIGAGHNGLVAASLLARAGLRVTVLEAQPTVGGACKTEYPFAAAPRVGQSTGAYLLGLMPPELLDELGLELPLVRRDPHYFLPTLDRRYLLFGADEDACRQQFEKFFGRSDWEAHRALQDELAALREDLAPSWLSAPLSIEETGARYVRPQLQDVFVELCRGSVGAYLSRFGFESDLVQAMYAVTDGFPGCFGDWDTPGTGMNFLVHSMCRLPGSDGTWMVVRGGMGTVASALLTRAQTAGAEVRTATSVREITVRGGEVKGVVDDAGVAWSARAVLVACDPFRLPAFLGDACSGALTERLAQYQTPGTTMKVNLCLRDLPRFTALPEDHGQHRATIHLLPDGDVLGSLARAFAEAKAGVLPEHPSIEWYIHTTLDPSLSDERGYHSSALFVQWVPTAPRDGSWAEREDDYVAHLLAICDRFAPGTSDLVVDTFPLTPSKIASHFGITHGHIHHIDNRFGFSDRLPYRLDIHGLFACGAGCHPGGSVIGAAGRNAAHEVLDALRQRQ